LLFPITSLCIAACIVGAYRRDGRRGPLVLALGAWAVSLLLGSPILFEYAVDYSLEADAFVAACLTAVTIFYLFFRRAPRPVPPTYEKRAQEILVAKLLGMTGTLGCLLLLADAYFNAGLHFSISYLLDNLSAIRTENFDTLASAASRGGRMLFLGTYFAPCAVLSVVAAVRLGQAGGRLLRMLGIVNFALIAALSLLVYAGRATVINVALLGLISLFVSGRRLSPFRPRTLLLGTLLLISVWYLSTSWLGTRENDASTVAILDETQRAELRPWIKGAAENDPNLGLAMVSLGYFASPVPTLAFYMQQPIPGPFYGAYSYPLAARVVGTFNGTWTRDQWIATRRMIYAPIEARGYFGNVWATWLRDLLVDFGYIGAIVFCVLFGAFMSWTRNRYELTGALHYHYLEVIACFTLGFGAFTSFMWWSFLAIPFLLALAIMVGIRLSLAPTPMARRRLRTTAQ
jgi:hypothetical protein